MAVVYYDLETTGINPPDHRGVEIINIGARTDMVDFEVFIQPRGPIDPRATEVHGMFKDQYGRLKNRNNRIVRTADTAYAGLEMFLGFLKWANCQYLVAHNNYKFDYIVLRQNLEQHPLIVNKWFNKSPFPPLPFIAIDSMTFIKKHFPGMHSYSLPNCMRAICNREPLQHHDALSDAKDVQALCQEGARRLQHGGRFGVLHSIQHTSGEDLGLEELDEINSRYFDD